jgi:hypothetical protein
MLAQTYLPAIQEVEMRRIMVLRPAQVKSQQKTIPTNKTAES